MQMDKILAAIFGLVLFGFGFIGKHFIDSYNVISFSDTINWEVNPFGFLSLLVTVLLAIYVTRTLSKKNEKEKIESELLINYLLQFKEDLLNRFQYISSQDNIQQTKINSDCKILRKRLHSILELAVDNNYIGQDDQIINNLKEKIREIWEILTDTPQKPNGKTSKGVTDGMAILRTDRLNKVETSIIDIEKLIFNFIIKLKK